MILSVFRPRARGDTDDPVTVCPVRAARRHPRRWRRSTSCARRWRSCSRSSSSSRPTQAIGAGRYERTEERTTHRNGTRTRLLSTKAGDVKLHIPKLREGSFFPALLEPRRRIDRALWAVIMEAYVHGVSTRKVDDLVDALGIDAGVSEERGVAASAPSSTRSWPPSATARLDHIALPLRLPRRHLRQGPRRRARSCPRPSSSPPA